jgi:simple sugar transport system ATP-binding protein
MTIEDNLALRDFARPPFARHGRRNGGAVRRHAEARVAEYDVRAAGPTALARSLSGGNQQKLVVARELGRNPGVLVALQPTWGLDPGATRFVIERVLALAGRGAAVLYISSELEEVLEVGDRVGVLFDGRVVAVVERASAGLDRIGLWMSGGAALAA